MQNVRCRQRGHHQDNGREGEKISYLTKEGYTVQVVECSICHIKQAWNVENKYAKEGRGLTEFNARGEGWKITADKDHNNDMVCICPLCVKALDSKSALQVIEALRPNLQDPEVKKILQTAFDELLKVNHLSNRGL